MPPHKLPTNTLSLRQTFPPILILPKPFFGNNVPKSMHKTRRTWHTNVQRIDQPIQLLDSAHRNGKMKMLKGVKMTPAHLRDFEKAGGVEGCLLSRPPKDFTEFGQDLRTELFARLQAIQQGSLTKSQLNDKSSRIYGSTNSIARNGFTLGDGLT